MSAPPVSPQHTPHNDRRFGSRGPLPRRPGGPRARHGRRAQGPPSPNGPPRSRVPVRRAVVRLFLTPFLHHVALQSVLHAEGTFTTTMKKRGKRGTLAVAENGPKKGVQHCGKKNCRQIICGIMNHGIMSRMMCDSDLTAKHWQRTSHNHSGPLALSFWWLSISEGIRTNIQPS